MGERNEAAERLRKHIDQAASRDGYASIMQRDVTDALAAEHRATVERIRNALRARRVMERQDWMDVLAILDEEAAR